MICNLSISLLSFLFANNISSGKDTSSGNIHNYCNIASMVLLQSFSLHWNLKHTIIVLTICLGLCIYICILIHPIEVHITFKNIILLLLIFHMFWHMFSLHCLIMFQFLILQKVYFSLEGSFKLLTSFAITTFTQKSYVNV